MNNSFRIFLLFFVALITVSVSATYCLADDNIMTKAEFAEMIVKSAKIELPEGTKDLTDAEYHEVLFNVLVDNKIGYFAGAKASDPVSFEEFAGVLYNMVGGEEKLNTDEQLVYLADHGHIPPDFLVVRDVREGIAEYKKEKGSYPTQLDQALNGLAAQDNPFFTDVMQVAVDTSWTKRDFFYTAPSTGAVYTYEPESGKFSTTSNIDLNFAIETFTNFEKPKGEPEDEKELLDS
ncbi:MAG: hypothetical protein KAI43_09675 [Candidatus Aureabacteria bacterium]|nr:hypothetical protein [Candidatus Auribacterota bacterium]